MNLEAQKGLLREVADRDVLESSFDAWPSVRAAVESRRRNRLRQRALQLGALLVAMGVFAFWSLLTTSGPPVVSAEALLDRAGAVSDGLSGTARTYHITATTTFRPGVSQFVTSSVQQEETWFAGAGRVRQEVHSADWTTLTISNGARSWWIVTRQGQAYATPANGIRFSDTARLNPLAPEGVSIGDVLALVRKSGCGTAELRGEEAVAGRSAYVVTVTHTLKTGCGESLQAIVEPSPSPKLDAASLAAAEARVREKQAAVATETASRRPDKTPAGAVASPSPVPAERVTVVKPVDPKAQAELQRQFDTPMVDTFWIDKQTYVQLKGELNVGPKGSFVYEVTSIAYDQNIPDSTFEYAPPPGVHVLSSPAELKEKLAGK